MTELEYEFPVVYLLEDELDVRFGTRKPQDVRWLRACLTDPECIVFNAPRPLSAELSPTGEPNTRQMPGAPCGWHVAAVWDVEKNAYDVRSNHEDKASVLRLLTPAQARQMLIDSFNEYENRIWLAEPDQFEKHWRDSFRNRFAHDTCKVVARP
jgi:hypothetical protein